VRAQVTAWSERRSQAGASVVIIGVPPPVRAVLRCGGLHTADHTDTHGYAPLIWRLDGVGAGCSVPKCHRVGEDRPGLIVDCVDRRWLGAIVVGAASSLRIVSARARRCRHPAPAANAGQRHRMSPASTYTCRISRVSSRHPSTELLPPRSDEYGFWASRRAGPTARTGITPATIRPASHSRLRVKVNTRSPPCCRSVQQNT